MNMICRITDERINNPWDGEESEMNETKGLMDLSLYDIGAEDLTVWVSKNKQFGFDVEIENESGDMFIEKGIHPYAMESMAIFCKQFLSYYERLTEDK